MSIATAIYIFIEFLLLIILISVIGIDFIVQGNIKNENLKESTPQKLITCIVLFLFAVIYIWVMESILKDKDLFHILLAVTIGVFIVISFIGFCKSKKEKNRFGIFNQDFTPVLVIKMVTLLMIIGVIAFSSYIVSSSITENTSKDNSIPYIETQVSTTIIVAAICSALCVFAYNIAASLLTGKRYIQVCLQSLEIFGHIEAFIGLIGIGYAIFGAKADFDAPEKSILIFSLLLLVMIIFDKMYWRVYLWMRPIQSEAEERLEKLEYKIKSLESKMNKIENHS